MGPASGTPASALPGLEDEPGQETQAGGQVPVQVPVPAALGAAGQEEQVGVGVVLTAPTAEPDRQQVTTPLGATRRQSLAEQAEEAQQLVRQPAQQPQAVQPQRQGQAPWRGKLSEREEARAEKFPRSKVCSPRTARRSGLPFHSEPRMPKVPE